MISRATCLRTAGVNILSEQRCFCRPQWRGQDCGRNQPRLGTLQNVLRELRPTWIRENLRSTKSDIDLAVQRSEAVIIPVIYPKLRVGNESIERTSVTDGFKRTSETRVPNGGLHKPHTVPVFIRGNYQATILSATL